MPVTQILRATSYLLLLGCGLNIHAADVYKSVGADGQTVYSDKPGKGATKLQAVELNVTKAPAASPKTIADTGSGSTSSPNDDPGSMGPSDMNSIYQQFVETVSIDNPEHDMALVNPASTLLISLSTGPNEGLPQGFTAQIQIDGEVVSSGPSTLLSVPTPHRGTHVMEAQILDRSGQLHVQSEAITFHVIKSTVR